MKLETSIGPIEASALQVQVLTSDVPVGQLKTTNYYFGDQLVKVDQHLEVSEAALEAAGFSQL